MKKSILIMLCCFCLSILTAQNPDRKGGGWQALGTASAQHSLDHESIILRQPVNVKKLKVTVRDEALTITKVVIQYDNGEEEIIENGMAIPKNGESNVVDIKSGVRNIKRLDFWYNSTDFTKGKAEVTIFGRK